jgi:hypothetical protein
VEEVGILLQTKRITIASKPSKNNSGLFETVQIGFRRAVFLGLRDV